MKILGINISHHASSCLLEDNEIKFLLEDERINRVKCYCPTWKDLEVFQKGEFKVNFAEELLKYTSHVDYIIFSSYDRDRRPEGEMSHDEFIIKCYLESMEDLGITWDEVVFEKENHHIYHACSGFYGSKFDEAVALVLDGGGSYYENEDDVTNLLGDNARNRFREGETIFKVDYESGVQPLWKHYTWNEGSILEGDVRNSDHFAEKYGDNVLSGSMSCGMLFNLLCFQLGFKDGNEAGKVMGMSSYYEKQFYYAYNQNPESDPRWWRYIDWFTEVNGTWVTSPELHEKLLEPRENGEGPYGHERGSEKHEDFMTRCDVANKLQEETLNHTKRLISKAVELSGCKNVILSGGYALNCLNNYQYLDIDPLINLYVDPLCYDAGTALGAAKWLYYKLTKSKEKNPLTSLYLS